MLHGRRAAYHSDHMEHAPLLIPVYIHFLVGNLVVVGRTLLLLFIVFFGRTRPPILPRATALMGGNV